MTTTPQPPPEAALIAARREAADMTPPEAARRAGISVTRWRQVESGRRWVGPGDFRPESGSARVLARMARAAGVTPAELEQAAAARADPDAAARVRKAAGLLAAALASAPDESFTEVEQAADAIARARGLTQAQRDQLTADMRAAVDKNVNKGR